MLQNPTPSTVNVVWFTEFPGHNNYVQYGNGLLETADANSTLLSRMREDTADGSACVMRPIYRHEATLINIPREHRVPYRVVSVRSNSDAVVSRIYSCRALPKSGMPLKILFSSDHQLKPMVAANMQKIEETVGRVDGVFFAGDMVNHADIASEWFDDPKGGAFFPALQGAASRDIHGEVYSGGEILQYAPLYGAVGNHEVMGRWTMDSIIDVQFNDPHPREFAEELFNVQYPNNTDVEFKERWIKDHSFNIDSYEEIFTFPTSGSGSKKYYAVSFSDIRLVVLYATRIWRRPQLDRKGKYTEAITNLNNPQKWGYGDFIFEPIQKGSPQYEWLEKELQSPEFQNAKYKIVMLHNPLHSLGENSTPPFADPIQTIKRNDQGEIVSVRYEYPIEDDVLIRDIEPLLEQYGVQLVLNGHTHIWNRFQSKGKVHHLETFNVGNSYGAYYGSNKRSLVPADHHNKNYVATGDPNGLEPITPTIAPLKDKEGNAMPYISSNDITVFTIFNTEDGSIDSYYFDTRDSNSEVVLFDRFYIDQ